MVGVKLKQTPNQNTTFFSSKSNQAEQILGFTKSKDTSLRANHLESLHSQIWQRDQSIFKKHHGGGLACFHTEPWLGPPCMYAGGMYPGGKDPGGGTNSVGNGPKPGGMEPGGTNDGPLGVFGVPP